MEPLIPLALATGSKSDFLTEDHGEEVPSGMLMHRSRVLLRSFGPQPVGQGNRIRN